MSIEEVRHYLSLLETQLAARLGWGPIPNWTYSQFSQLAEAIESQLGVSISYLTLTRILQEKQYKRSPQLATLNALAQFLGYRDWPHFCAEAPAPEPTKASPPKPAAMPGPETAPHPVPRRRSRVGLWVGFSILCLLGLGWLLWKSPFMAAPAPPEVRMDLRDSVSTFPHAIPVSYSVPTAGYALHILPQSALSLNIHPLKPEQLIPLPPEDSLIWLSQEVPIGSFEVRLLDAKTGNIHAQAQGLQVTPDWIGILQADVRQTKQPRYKPVSFKPERAEAEGHLTLSADLKEQIENSWVEKIYWVNYYLLRDFGLSPSDYQVEMRLRHLPVGSMEGLQVIRITLLTDYGMIEVPLFNQEGKHLPKVWISELEIKDKDPRLLAFKTANLDQWQQVTLGLKPRQLQVIRNDTLLNQFAFERPLGRLTGIRIRFRGMGEVDYVRLRDASGNMRYQDEFEAGSAME